MRAYGRMGSPPDHRDARAAGGNPCLEQTLESYELCCLVETFPARADDLDDYLATLRCAFLYAKTVTLGATHWPASNAVMLRNRRVGCSMSGIAQFVAARGTNALTTWADAGYAAVQDADARLSAWLAVPRSIKTTSVKPSGTVSLLAGATPGMHWPEARFYLRRVRIGATHDTVAPLRAAGYTVEPAAEDPTRKVVVTFPIDVGAGTRTLDDVSMWEQLALAALLQRHWADNQVSSTVTFDPATEGPHIAAALNYYQYQLKGVSMLPRTPTGAYAQMPYEAISEERYRREVAKIVAKPDFGSGGGGGAQTQAANTPPPDSFCDNDACS
jgi:adenosylcobalamin-dependent ribonucleoside-triphosphate reductase